jgi:hypothetical protein
VIFSTGTVVDELRAEATQFRAIDLSERARVALQIADSTIGARGFFP